MLISIEPISSFDHVDELALIVQIMCLFTGEVLEGDISWDDDLLFQSFIDAKVQEGEDREILANYESERNKTIELAKEQMLSDVRTIIRECHEALSVHSPFNIKNEEGIVLCLKDFSEIGGAGSAYLWQTLFDLINTDNNYLQISDEDYRAFHQHFSTVFELIACYALAGRREQAVWYTGRNRSAKQFVEFLQRLVSFIGTGLVKTYEQLDDNQKRVNEAGVDGICLTLTDKKVHADAELMIMQSTIQKTNRRIKVMGANEVARFRNFFINNPRTTVQGVLAIPFNSEPIDVANCTDLNCIYMPRKEILKYIGREPLNTNVRLGTRRLDALMHVHNLDIVGKIKMKTVDGQFSIA